MDSNRKNWRSRNFCLLLYPESQSEVMEYIKQHYSFAACLHDKDCDENGELKKAHWHVIVKFVNARWCSSIADELGISDRFIDKYRGLDNFAYLIHYGNDDKYQYELSEVFGDLKNLVNKACKRDTEIEITMLNVLEMLDTYPDYLDFITCFRLICDAGAYSEVNRGWMGRDLVFSVIQSHNRRLDKLKGKGVNL